MTSRRALFVRDGEPADFYPPRTKWELKALVQYLFGYNFPATAVCPGHSAPLDAIWDAYTAKYPIMVWKASRGFGGKSTMLATLSVLEMLTGMKVAVLGGSAQQSRRVHEVTDDIWEHAIELPGGEVIEGPLKHLLAQDPNQMETRARNGAWLRALTASTKSARGPHPQRLNLDEVDEMDLMVFDAAMGQTMEGGSGHKAGTVISSTHQYPDKTMSEVLRRADEKGWPVYFWCLTGDSPVLTRRGRIALQDVDSSTDEVMTRKGWKRVQHLTFMGIKPTITLEFSNGERLTCTPDHLIATPRGWVEAGLLVPASVVDLPTYSTLPSASVSVGVSSVVRVPPRAFSFEVPPIVPTAFSLGQQAQMVGIDAGAVAAQVVDYHSVLNRPIEDSIAQAMSIPEFSVTVPRRKATPLPLPTSSRSDLHALSYVIGIENDSPWHRHLLRVVSVTPGNLEPVYDLGVEEAHEFVAAGVVVHNCYRENLESNDGWLPDYEVERKRQEVSAQMFTIEYDLTEPTIEGRAIDTDAVDRTFSKSRGTYSGAPGEYLEFEAPDPEGRYATGTDWAKESDWTVIVTFRTDGPKWKMVAFERVNRIAWPAMIERLNKRLERFGGVAAHDATGAGNVVNDYIRHSTKAVIMMGKERQRIFSDWVVALEQGQIEAPFIEWVYYEHLYVSVNDLYGHGTGAHPPDSLVACALAWSLRKKQVNLVAPIFRDLTKTSLWS